MSRPIGILCAGIEELLPFLPHLREFGTEHAAMLVIHRGCLQGLPVAALCCGTGKVNAALAAQLLIDRFQVRCILNPGTAGGIDRDVRLFDTVVTTECAYHDMEETILTDSHPNLPSPWFPADPGLLALARTAFRATPAVRFGRTVTGDCFISRGARTDLLHRWSPLSVDMETTAIAHVCHANAMPFLAIRSITDTAAYDGLAAFEENCEAASRIAKDAVLCLLDAMAAESCPDASQEMYSAPTV